MAKKSKKFQNNYLFDLKGKLIAEQMVNDSFKKTNAKQAAQIENLKNQVRNLSENEKRLNDEIAKRQYIENRLNLRICELTDKYNRIASNRGCIPLTAI